MAGPPLELDRREFLAAAGVGLPTWSPTTAPILPEPQVAWTFGVPEESFVRARVVDREEIYVTSKSALYALTTDGERRWTLPVEDERSNVRLASVDEQTLYVGVRGEAVYAVDRKTGDVRWGREDADEQWRYAVAIDDTVFTLGDRLAALSTADGRVQWEFDTAGDGFHEPVVSAGVVVAGTWDGVIHVVDAATGTERWSFERPYDHDGRAELQPVDVVEPESSDVLVLVWDRLKGRLSGLELADGSERWRFEAKADSFVLPGIVTDEAVFVVDDRSLVALSLANGETRWRFETDESLSWPTAVGDDTIYVSGGNGVLYACSKADGTERWRFSTETDDGVVTNRSVGNTLVADDWNGTCYGLDPTDGNLRWAYEYGSETAWYPQVVDERVYFGTNDGVVYALDPPPATALDQLRRDAANAEPSTVLGPLLAGSVLGGSLALASRWFDRDEPDERPTWNDFELCERVGEGTTGVVHRARTPDDEEIALKRFDDGNCGDELADALETWADLDHDGVLVSEAKEGSSDRRSDGVLPVRAWGIDPDPWVAMEYADGGSLADHLGDLDREEGVEIVSSVAETVHRAHREGVTHGRLHPDNVLFADPECKEVLVSDWRGAATRAELPRGYAAPGQQADEGAVEGGDEAGDEDPVAADIYQLGCLAVHVLTGRPPKVAAGPSAVEGQLAVDGEAFPDALIGVLETALAPDLDDRYESALAFRDDIRWATFQA